MFGDVVRDGFKQHFLLVFIQIDSEFLKGFDGGIVRRVIPANVLLGEAAGLNL